jgi:hypothetical protein
LRDNLTLADDKAWVAATSATDEQFQSSINPIAGHQPI